MHTRRSPTMNRSLRAQRQRRLWRRCAVAALVLFVTATGSAAAQLAGRAADEWIKTLESPARVDAMKVDQMMSALKIVPGQTVADIGAGSGALSGPLALTTGPAGTMYAVDIDRQLLAHIEQRAKDQKIGNIKTVLGEFTDPKLPNQVDLALFNDVLHHVDDRASYLTNLAKYVKPGGRIAVIDYLPERSSHRAQPELVVSEQQVDGWMKAAGLRLFEKVTLYDDRFFVVYAKP